MLIQQLVDFKLKEKNISKYQLAKMLSTSPSNIYRYLKGGLGMLGNEKIVALSEIVGIDYYHLLLGITPPKELVHFIDPTNQELSFQKSLFYLSLLHDSQIYDFDTIRESLDSTVIALGDLAGNEFNTTDEISIQFLTDILLYSQNLPNQIIKEFINSRLTDLYTYTSFDKHQLTDNLNNLSTKAIKEEVKKKHKNDEDEVDELAIALGFNPLSTDKINLLNSIYRRRIDVYYLYINGDLTINEATLTLSKLDNIEYKLVKPRFSEFEYILFEIFNEPKLFSNHFGHSSGRTQARNLCLLQQLDPLGFEYSYQYIKELYPYLSKVSKNHIIAVRINDDSLNKILNKKSYAIVEMGGDVESGNYALISIKKQTPVVAKVTILPEKVVVEFNSTDAKKFTDKIYIKDEVRILGKVIDYITKIK